MARLLAFFRSACILVMVLGVAGPLTLMTLMAVRGERLDGQLAMGICAGIAVGCSRSGALVYLVWWNQYRLLRGEGASCCRA